MKKIIYILIAILLLLIILINILSTYNLSLLGIRIFRISSGSMEPYLKINSIIIVKECDDYNVDDVIIYKDSIGHVTHRIIEVNDNEIITKGDANNQHDDPIKKDKIIGKVIVRLNWLSTINNLLSSSITWPIILFIGLAFIYLLPNKKN